MVSCLKTWYPSVIICIVVSFHHSGVSGCAWRLWAESVQLSEQPVFLSVHAKGWNEFKKGRANNGDIIQMGFDCPPR